MPETKTQVIEREYIIPLREKIRVSPRYKKTPKAIRTVKEFLVKHMKVYDRDVRKIKIDRYLNEYLWFRGIRNPPHKVKVKAIREEKDGNVIVKVYLSEMHKKTEAKKARLEKREKAGEKKEKTSEKKKDTKEEGVQSTNIGKETTPEEKEKTKEAEKEIIESGEKITKEEHKGQKHQTKKENYKSETQIESQQKGIKKG
ncbi:MAG: 50S ribosomal protein L31e [Nanoarchaeota archaeon]|nr:50S ribosomal protein L31e [Nanoarchaeota archaeon]